MKLKHELIEQLRNGEIAVRGNGKKKIQRSVWSATEYDFYIMVDKSSALYLSIYEHRGTYERSKQ